MLNNIAKYSATACLVSVLALNANIASAELVVNKPMISEVAKSAVLAKDQAPVMMAKAPTKAKAVHAKQFKPAPAKIEKVKIEKMVEKPMAKPAPIHAHTPAKKMKTMPMKHHMMEKKHNTKMMHEEKPLFKPMAEWMDGKNYFKIKAGVAQPLKFGGNTKIDKTPDGALVVGAVIGRTIWDGISADLEYTHRAESKASFTEVVPPLTRNYKWSVQSDTLMANINLNLIHNSQITPYIRAGLGLSRNKTGTYSLSTSNSVSTNSSKTINSFAWQAGFGMSFAYSPVFDTELEYVFINRGSMKSGSVEADQQTNSVQYNPGKEKATKLKDHVVTFGIKIKF